MKIHGVLRGTVQEQIAGGDDEPLDPEGFLPTGGIPVTVEFDWSRPVGVARAWVEDGRLMFEADVASVDGLPPTAAIAAKADRPEIVGVALTSQGSRADQPAWSVRPR